MFLLRCAFWLSVVYAAMFYGVPRHAALPAPEAAGTPSAMAAAGAAAGPIVSEIATLCRDRAGDCLRDAAGLTALIETATAGAPDYAMGGGTAGAAPAAERADAIPTPAPDPRRRGRLTR